MQHEVRGAAVVTPIRVMAGIVTGGDIIMMAGSMMIALTSSMTWQGAAIGQMATVMASNVMIFEHTSTDTATGQVSMMSAIVSTSIGAIDIDRKWEHFSWVRKLGWVSSVCKHH